MRNVQVLCAGATVLAAMMLTGCSKSGSEPQTPPKQESKKPADGDSPIIISDSSTNRPKTPNTPVLVQLYMETSPAGTGPAFSSWSNNGNNGNGISEVYPTYTTFNGVTVTVNGTATSYCTPGQECQVKIKYENNNSPSIFFHYKPNATHPMTLRSTVNNFETWTNWQGGNDITDPTNTQIKEIKIQASGGADQTTTCTSADLCSVSISVQ